MTDNLKGRSSTMSRMHLGRRYTSFRNLNTTSFRLGGYSWVTRDVQNSSSG